MLISNVYHDFTFLCPSVFAISTHAQENGSIPYGNINKMLSIINDYAKSSYTGLIATITPEVKEVQFADIRLTIVHEEQVIKQLFVDDKCVVDFPLLASEIGEKAKLEINQPKGSVSLAFSAGIKAIREHRVYYREIISALGDLETVASELVGIPSWLIPDIDHIEFVFNSPASITLRSKRFTKVHRTNTDLKIELERNDDLLASNVELVFSVLPASVNIVK